VEFYRTVDQAMALVAKVPDVPVSYMVARPVEVPPNWPLKRMQAFIRAKQVQLPKTVPNGRLVEVQSSHDIDLEKPGLVIQEIQRILDGVARRHHAAARSASTASPRTRPSSWPG
jgi:hypothetical protein